MKKWKMIGIGSILVSTALILVLFLSPPLRSQIQMVSGLAVAQSAIQWNNLKDAAVGDNITNGLMASGPYGFDGTNWDRLLSSTHGDNLTTATGLNVSSFGYVFDGVNWDRIRGTGGAINVTLDTAGTGFYAIKRVNIAGASANLAFGFTSKKVIIETPATNTDEIAVDWIGGTAVVPAANTAGDDLIAPGRIVTFDGYAVTSISVIAVSGTQTVYVRAYY